MGYILGYLFIFFARCLDVSMATTRTIMVVKGKKFTAATIGFFEIIIYVFAINKVLSGMNNIGNVLSYALGFATGNYLGVVIEEKMALGTLIVQIVTTKDVEKFSKYLRENGFGITVMEGHGKEGKIHILQSVLHRKDLNSFERYVNKYDESAFMTISDARTIRGGYFKNRIINKK
ncbi:Uncharacterized protein YebE, UPF0316 family [Alkalithermobacter thermoalcaliphilus JW-YL-7 = DSM 7308]|uniref:UPF0316 protein JWYL7_1440 n=1 Tax=Alkalithermobacter thermoalcaliphilus JW-YL-7 = DSM 7308 TaxID=1121328 RepID=A0A150FT66_CLOPD|nr:UPF0316 protein [[Clostridium] paradoxum JW-YL-7 = DSM 7308]SHK36082.1 Uncharacterized protein YebE, UPF0316 family [[Clostridium] paradoxum JW-YL-7 = DSM 7308]